MYTRAMRDANRSRRRLAAAGDADLLGKSIAADRADHHLLADHVARRAVHAHSFGELEIFLNRCAHFRARGILLKPGHVEAGFLGGAEGAPLLRLPVPPPHPLTQTALLLAPPPPHAHP